MRPAVRPSSQRARAACLRRPVRARQLPVGDVADQRVHEDELRLALHRAAAHGSHELLGGELVQAAVHVGDVPAADRGDRTGPERAAHHGGVGEQGLAVGAEQVEARSDERADGVGHGHVDAGLQRDLAAAVIEEVAVLEQPDQLLGEQRVAAGALEQHGLQARRQRLGAQAGEDERPRLLAGERAEIEARGAGDEAGPGAGQLEHLLPRRREHEQAGPRPRSARGSP